MIKFQNKNQTNFLVGSTQVYSIYKGDTFIQGKEVERKELYIQGNNDDYFFLPSLKNGDVVKLDYEGSIDGWLCGYILGRHENAGFVWTSTNALINAYTNNDNRSDRRILTVTSTSEQTEERFGVFAAWTRSINRGKEGPYPYVVIDNNTGAGARGKLYSVEIYRNNELVIKYMPYYADNKTGLKDVMSGNIYWSKKNTFSPMP